MSFINIIETQFVHLDESYDLQHPEIIPGDHVMLAVRDTGNGMDEETKKQIFEPFYTTKGIGKGTGLGLSTVYGIVRQSGGSICAYSEPDHGTTFKIYLPQVAETTTGQEDLPLLGRPMHGTKTILFVEDEGQLRKMAGKILKGYGYAVVEAQDGVEALEITANRNYPEIDLLMTDVIMPRMNGRQLSEAILEEHPDMKILLVSGYTDNSIVREGMLDEGVSYHNPFSDLRYRLSA
jgi:two-component system, cell cycle sensor histidine kinase and response regulator CckA